MGVLKDQEVDDCFGKARELRRIDEGDTAGPSGLHAQLTEDNEGLFDEADYDF